MDRVSQYQELVKKVITDYVSSGSHRDEIEQQLNFDLVRHHYQIVQCRLGW